MIIEGTEKNGSMAERKSMRNSKDKNKLDSNKQSRELLLNKDLSELNTRQWSVNLPGRDFKIRNEDMVPAFAGVIGKISLTGAFALAWMEALGIKSDLFAVENVRMELFLASLLTLLFCVFFNPAIAPPGTLAPLIPLVPVMVAAGVHPLPLALISGALGIILAALRAWPLLMKLSGNGTKAGVLILFGIMGIESAGVNLFSWSGRQIGAGYWLGAVLLLAGAAGFYLLFKRGKVWLAIPMSVLIGLLLPLFAGILPVINSSPGLPILNPYVWWHDLWGIGWGMNTAAWLASLPYALLIVIMWPLDAVAITAMHERSYGEHSERVIFKINPTFLLVGLRNIVGTLLGGSQTAAVWRSFLIPLGVVRRPLPGAALLLAILGIVFSLIGYPLDLAMFNPLLNLVLIFGVFMPMFLAGVALPTGRKDWLIAAVCIIPGYFFHPLAGWGLAVLLELFLKREAALTKRGRL